MNDDAEKMIRFIDSHYKTLFFVPDGGNVVVTRPDGQKITSPCKFVDSCHTKVGFETYHILQFAELMERAGNIYAPEITPELPDQCFSVLPATGELIRIERGKKGYQKCGFSRDNPAINRREADSLNLRQRITPQAEAAMLGGALKGWASPAARVSSYDVRGNPIKPAKTKARKSKGAER